MSDTETVRQMLERFGPGDDVPWVYVQALLNLACVNPSLVNHMLIDGQGADSKIAITAHNDGTEAARE